MPPMLRLMFPHFQMPALRRSLLGALLPLLMILPSTAVSDTRPYYKVPQAHDLVADGKLAQQTKRPILIMFSQSGCLYCDQVREEFLEPMRKSGDYKDKIIMRIIKLDSFEEVRDFDGHWRDPSDIAVRYRASVTPTVIVVDHRGHQLAERILGITTPAFYGGELDDAIELGLQRLRPSNASLQAANP